VLSARAEAELIDAAIRAGAADSILKDESIEGYIYALDQGSLGKAVLGGAVAPRHDRIEPTRGGRVTTAEDS